MHARFGQMAEHPLFSFKGLSIAQHEGALHRGTGTPDIILIVGFSKEPVAALSAWHADWMRGMRKHNPKDDGRRTNGVG